MGQERHRPESEEAKHQVLQRAHDLVVLSDKQQADQNQSQRQDRPTGINAGENPDPGRSCLQIGRNGHHVDGDDRYQEDGGDFTAITPPRQRLEVAARHRADMCRDGLDDAQERSHQEGNPGQLIAGLCPDGDCRAHIGRIVVRRPREQLGSDAPQKTATAEHHRRPPIRSHVRHAARTAPHETPFGGLALGPLYVKGDGTNNQCPNRGMETESPQSRTACGCVRRAPVWCDERTCSPKFPTERHGGCRRCSSWSARRCRCSATSVFSR